MCLIKPHLHMLMLQVCRKSVDRMFFDSAYCASIQGCQLALAHPLCTAGWRAAA